MPIVPTNGDVVSDGPDKGPVNVVGQQHYTNLEFISFCDHCQQGAGRFIVAPIARALVRARTVDVVDIPLKLRSSAGFGKSAI